MGVRETLLHVAVEAAVVDLRSVLAPAAKRADAFPKDSLTIAIKRALEVADDLERTLETVGAAP